ncbi:MAG: alanine racemase [Actinobacteria bacterium]|jgi:pyridoxal phosphate enzyme (YggS family)|nr:alanine racemase [Actinomycetota bacterium]MCL6105330.1 alanine racemase [Actinomycetota bacterium]
MTEEATKQEISKRLEVIRSRIQKTGVDPDKVKLIAVTKGWGAEVVSAALEAGLSDFGENYAKELLQKATLEYPRSPSWHFIGIIRRNKVKALGRYVKMWHSVSRIDEGRWIAGVAPGSDVLVQPNSVALSSEVPQGSASPRNGCAFSEVPQLVESLKKMGLSVLGLMVVAPTASSETSARDIKLSFSKVAKLAGELGLKELSMGMTDDLEQAVEVGATMIRVGRGLFGERTTTVGNY